MEPVEEPAEMMVAWWLLILVGVLGIGLGAGLGAGLVSLKKKAVASVE